MIGATFLSDAAIHLDRERYLATGCGAVGIGVGIWVLAGLLIPVGLVFLVFLVFPVMFWAVFLRHQREALHDRSQ